MRDYGLDGGDSSVRSADLQLNNASASTAASITSKDSYSITIENLPVKLNGKYNFVFQYYYQNPDKTQSTPILGPASATYSISPTIQDLSTAPTNVVATGGFYSYQLKWDTPTFVSYGDTIVYESNSNSFNSSSKVVYVGTANQCTILTSDIISKYVYVVHRDMFLDANKKGTVVGPITIQDPITVDTTGPSNVTSVTASGGLESGGTIGFNGYVDVSWPAVTGNGIRGYRIRYKATGSTNYSYADSPGTGTTYRLTGLGVGLTYEIAVATYDEYNNTSTSYVSATNVAISGTPFIASTVNVTGYFNATSGGDTGSFKFGYGVDTGKRGLVFNANNYWYIDSNQSASLKVGGASTNYISWNGTTFAIDGDITARSGTFSGNILMSTSNASIYNGTINSAGNLTGNGFALNSTGLKVANGSNSVTLDAASGQITANAGIIGGWSLLIDNTVPLLSSNSARLSSAGFIELGAANTDNIIRIDANDATYRMWIGRNSSTTAPFKVTKEGALYASGATITGNSTFSGTISVSASLSDGGTIGDVKTTASNAATTANNALPALSFDRDAVINKINSNTTTTTIDGGKLSTGTVKADAVVSTFISAFEINADKITAGTLTGRDIDISNDSISNRFKTSYNRTTPVSGITVSTLGINAIAMISTSTAGVVSSWYPYLHGEQDLGVLSPNQFYWRNLRYTNSLIQSSDRRLKRNIEVSDLGLEFINSLRPVKYQRYYTPNSRILDDEGKPIINEDGSQVVDESLNYIGNRYHYGLIAQEVKESLDLAGVGSSFSGWVLDDPEDVDSYQSLGYDKFISPIIKSIQELSDMVELLQEEVNTLKGI
jgi:hypothetical protein